MHSISRFPVSASSFLGLTVSSWSGSDTQILLLAGGAIAVLAVGCSFRIRARNDRDSFILLGSSPLPPGDENDHFELPKAA
jgi:hypothetical protein